MEEEQTVCSDCLAEPGDPAATPQDLKNEGWDLDGEFGARCPGCAATNTPPTAGGEVDFVEAIKEATEQVKKKAKKRKPRKKK